MHALDLFTEVKNVYVDLTQGDDATISAAGLQAGTALTARRFAALVAGKAAAVGSRISGRGGGTSLPGMVARRLDPGILRALVAEQGVTVVAITGSNGKTTTARFMAAILRGAGLPVAHNQAGANLVQGVTSLAVPPTCAAESSRW